MRNRLQPFSIGKASIDPHCWDEPDIGQFLHDQVG